MKEPVKIVPSVLKEQVEKGMKKKELANYYNLPMTQMTKVLQQANLKIRKFHEPKFIFVEETEENFINNNLEVSTEKQNVITIDEEKNW